MPRKPASKETKRDLKNLYAAVRKEGRLRSDSELAKVVDMDRSTVRGWRHGKGADAETFRVLGEVWKGFKTANLTEQHAETLNKEPLKREVMAAAAKLRASPLSQVRWPGAGTIKETVPSLILSFGPGQSTLNPAAAREVMYHQTRGTGDDREE